MAENAAHIAPPGEASIKAYLDTSRPAAALVGIIDGDDGRPAAVCWSVRNGGGRYPSGIIQEGNWRHPLIVGAVPTLTTYCDFERWTADRWSEQHGYRLYLVTADKISPIAREDCCFYLVPE